MGLDKIIQTLALQHNPDAKPSGQILFLDELLFPDEDSAVQPCSEPRNDTIDQKAAKEEADKERAEKEAAEKERAERERAEKEKVNEERAQREKVEREKKEQVKAE